MTTHDDRAGQPVCRVDGLVYRLYRHIIARSRLTVQTLGQRDDTALGVNSKLSFCCVARLNDLVSQLAVLTCNSNTVTLEWSGVRPAPVCVLIVLEVLMAAVQSV